MLRVPSGSPPAGSRRNGRSSLIRRATNGAKRANMEPATGCASFDGKELFLFEEGENEFVRIKRRPNELPVPVLYADTEWQKAVEVERLPCTVAGELHTCVTIDLPLKSSVRQEGNGRVAVTKGKERVAIALDTGVVVTVTFVTTVESVRMPYVTEITYTLTRSSFSGETNPGLFKLSDGAHEVKELSKWNAARIGRQFAGKPAPEFTLTDLQGKAVSLASLKGKTILLDFWATWCRPCRADGPALDKLQEKYGENLQIIGISVAEDRPIVEKFLKDHRHAFPIVMTSENDMPRAFQIGVIPTYIVIDKDGTVSGAVEGDQGFAELRKILKKAGMEVD